MCRSDFVNFQKGGVAFSFSTLPYLMNEFITRRQRTAVISFFSFKNLNILAYSFIIRNEQKMGQGTFH